MDTDILVENHGSIMLLVPGTVAAYDWIEENVSDPMWFGGALAVERRYALDLVNGMLDDGLEVV